MFDVHAGLMGAENCLDCSQMQDFSHMLRAWWVGWFETTESSVCTATPIPTPKISSTLHMTEERPPALKGLRPVGDGELSGSHKPLELMRRMSNDVCLFADWLQQWSRTAAWLDDFQLKSVSSLEKVDSELTGLALPAKFCWGCSEICYMSFSLLLFLHYNVLLGKPASWCSHGCYQSHATHIKMTLTYSGLMASVESRGSTQH